MKIIISTKDLADRLAQVTGIIPKKAYMPAIQFLNLRVEGEEIVLTTTDLEVWVEARAAADILTAPPEGFSLCIPHRELEKTVKSLDEQPLSIEYDKEKGQIVLRSASGSYHIEAHGPDAMLFPQWPEPDEPTFVALPAAVLRRGIGKTQFAASTDQYKPAMHGLYFDLAPDGLTIVATDAHRLAQYTRTDVQADATASLLMPPKGLSRLTATIEAEDIETVDMQFDQYHAFFDLGSVQLVCRLIEGRFPDYKAVFPTTNDNRAIVDRRVLEKAIRRLDIYANKVTHLGVATFARQNLLLDSQDLNTNNKATEKVQAIYEGDETKIGFNLALLREVVAALETEDIIFAFDNGARPVIIEPSEQQDNERLVMLIMPVMLGY